MSKSVVVYSSPSCGPCKLVKDYLAKIGVMYTVKDIAEDQVALKELVETYHSTNTPTTVIDGQVVIGFNRDRIDKLLAR